MFSSFIGLMSFKFGILCYDHEVKSTEAWYEIMRKPYLILASLVWCHSSEDLDSDVTDAILIQC